MIALVVSIVVRPGAREAFLEAIAAQAAASLELEEGCLRFDVCAVADDPARFFLYEVYADQQAFDEHRTTPHFGRWRAAAAECVETQVNTIASIVAPAA